MAFVFFLNCKHHNTSKLETHRHVPSGTSAFLSAPPGPQTRSPPRRRTWAGPGWRRWCASWSATAPTPPPPSPRPPRSTCCWTSWLGGGAGGGSVARCCNSSPTFSYQPKRPPRPEARRPEERSDQLPLLGLPLLNEDYRLGLFVEAAIRCHTTLAPVPSQRSNPNPERPQPPHRRQWTRSLDGFERNSGSQIELRR